MLLQRVLAAFDPLDLISWEAGVPGWLGSESAVLKGEGAWEKLLGRRFQREARDKEEERRAGTQSQDLEGTKEKAGISKNRGGQIPLSGSRCGWAS